MRIEAMGSFFVGGHTVTVEGEPLRSIEKSRDVPAYVFNPNGTYAIDHAYVSYVIPAGTSRVRTAFPGSAFPVDALASLTRQMVPRWTTTGELSIAALRAAVEKIGRCVLIGHSQGGGFAARVASAAPSDQGAR
jgi:hypothetical protein